MGSGASSAKGSDKQADPKLSHVKDESKYDNTSLSPPPTVVNGDADAKAVSKESCYDSKGEDMLSINNSSKTDATTIAQAKKSPNQSNNQNNNSVDDENRSHFIDPDLLLDEDEDFLLAMEEDFDGDMDPQLREYLIQRRLMREHDTKKRASSDVDEEEEGDGEDSDDVDDVTRGDRVMNRDNWNMITNSLEMDNEELLFNMMYFGDGGIDESSLGSSINDAMAETMALHSEHNTPYKLKPASEKDMIDLKPETLSKPESDKIHSDHTDCDKQCSVCREDFLVQDKIIRLPICSHLFHADCLMKWLKLQNWCPICRASVGIQADQTKKILHEKENTKCGVVSSNTSTLVKTPRNLISTGCGLSL